MLIRHCRVQLHSPCPHIDLLPTKSRWNWSMFGFSPLSFISWFDHSLFATDLHCEDVLLAVCLEISARNIEDSADDDWRSCLSLHVVIPVSSTEPVLFSSGRFFSGSDRRFVLLSDFDGKIVARTTTRDTEVRKRRRWSAFSIGLVESSRFDISTTHRQRIKERESFIHAFREMGRIPCLFSFLRNFFDSSEVNRKGHYPLIIFDSQPLEFLQNVFVCQLKRKKTHPPLTEVVWWLEPCWLSHPFLCHLVSSSPGVSHRGLLKEHVSIYPNGSYDGSERRIESQSVESVDSNWSFIIANWLVTVDNYHRTSMRPWGSSAREHHTHLVTRSTWFHFVDPNVSVVMMIQYDLARRDIFEMV